MHRQAGREIAELGIDVLWGVRGLAAELFRGCGKGNCRNCILRKFRRCGSRAIGAAREGDLILASSRSVETDKVVTALRERFPLAGADR